MRILLADDDAIARTIVKAALKKGGYEVDAVHDGAAVINALKADVGPRILILDWMMPGMSGPEVCQAIRTNPGKSYVYVILLTSKSDRNEIIGGLDAGADDYIIKPFDQDQFHARIRVAERVLRVHQNLIDIIDEQEMLLRRHNLLGDMLHKQELPASKTQQLEAVSLSAKPLPATHFSNKIQNFGVISEIDQVFARIFAQMGVSPVEWREPAESVANGNPDFVSCTSLYIPQSGIWLDVLLEMDQPSTLAMGLAVIGTLDVTEKDMLDMLGETLNLFQRSMKAKAASENIDIMVPFMPKAKPRSEFGEFAARGVNFGHWFLAHQSIDCKITVSEHPSPSNLKKSAMLQPLSLVLETVPQPDRPGYACLEKGALLNEMNIRKVQQIAKASNKDIGVSVAELSPLAKMLCRR